VLSSQGLSSCKSSPCKGSPRSQARSLDRFFKHGFDEEVMRLLGVGGRQKLLGVLELPLQHRIASHFV
jgi:hypothetical protein